MTVTLTPQQVLTQLANDAIAQFHAHGQVTPGHNGPYNNDETAVRNTAHWLTTLAYLYEENHEEVWLDAIISFADELLDGKHYGTSGSICVRRDVRFDHTNGLIGQAWVIEGLIAAFRVTQQSRYLSKAHDLFKCQPFDYTLGLWRVCDVDGTADMDLTFNHQLWFAAAGSMILDHQAEPKINQEIQAFLDHAESSFFKIRESGQIVHAIELSLPRAQQSQLDHLQHRRKWASLRQAPLKVLAKKLHRKAVPFTSGLEDGYQLFDLYGFALLVDRFGQHPIFNSERLKQALRYVFDQNLVSRLEQTPQNKFAFAYNNPAFELGFIAQRFEQLADIERLWQWNLDHYWLDEKGFCGVEDPITLNARVYEVTRSLERTGG